MCQYCIILSCSYNCSNFTTFYDCWSLRWLISSSWYKPWWMEGIYPPPQPDQHTSRQPPSSTWSDGHQQQEIITICSKNTDWQVIMYQPGPGPWTRGAASHCRFIDPKHLVFVRCCHMDAALQFELSPAITVEMVMVVVDKSWRLQRRRDPGWCGHTSCPRAAALHTVQ